MEVAQCQQAPNERKQLAEYARQFGLLASQDQFPSAMSMD